MPCVLFHYQCWGLSCHLPQVSYPQQFLSFIWWKYTHFNAFSSSILKFFCSISTFEDDNVSISLLYFLSTSFSSYTLRFPSLITFSTLFIYTSSEHIVYFNFWQGFCPFLLLFPHLLHPLICMILPSVVLWGFYLTTDFSCLFHL